jgi:hypothetical protein
MVLQIAFSVALGWVMLVPRQPWGRALAPLLSKDFTAAHLDWFMLSFMQLGAFAALVSTGTPGEPWVAVCLIIGGWLNPVPYVLRAFGLNAFQLGGRPSQRIAGVSSLLISAGWVGLAVDVWD